MTENTEIKKVTVINDDGTEYETPCYALSAEDVLYSRIHDDIMVGALPFVNQVLRQFTTLNSAFVGGITAIYDKAIIHKEIAIVGMLFFVIGMFIAVVGMMPVYGRAKIGEVQSRKKMIDNGTRWKLNCTYATCIAFMIGVSFILVGVAVQLLRG
jgi:hypothetical protein